ncbi:MAG: MFS transporter [Pseudomonadota bacterium]
MSTRRSPPALTTLYLLAAISPLTLNMIVPSLANIAQDLRADYALISLAFGGYLAVTALVELAVGPLSDRIGRRPVLLVAIAVFTAASIGCASAQSAEAFLAFRMLQAGAISGYVLSFAIVRDTRDGPDVVALLGRIGMAMALAPMLGPTIGSLFDTLFGWRTVFLLYTCLGLGLVCVLWFDLGETAPERSSTDDGAERSVCALLRAPLFWCYALCTATSVSVFYIFLAGAPLIASAVFGITTATLGLFIGSITVGFFVGSFLASHLAARYPGTTVMLLGRGVACAGLLIGCAIVALGAATPLLYFGATVFAGLGNGLTLPGSNAGAMAIRPKLAGSAAGIMGAMTLAGGAALATLTGLAITRYTAPEVLLILMLSSAGAGLMFAALAAWLERHRTTSGTARS